jgi:hypothetical protein
MERPAGFLLAGRSRIRASKRGDMVGHGRFRTLIFTSQD